MRCILLSFIAFIGVLSTCSCEHSSEKPPASEKLDLSEEKRLLSAEKSEEDEAIPLLKIDKKIQQELENPTAPEASFEIQLKILKNIVNYYNRLKALHEGVHNNTAKKLEVARKLLEKNGPEFLKKEINEDKLKKVYNWDDESLEFFRDYIKDIKKEWDDLVKAMKEKPSPVEIFFDLKPV